METKSFEESLKELEIVVKNLENGNIPIEEAMKHFTKGIELAKFCNEKLTSIEQHVNKILTTDGELVNFELKED